MSDRRKLALVTGGLHRVGAVISSALAEAGYDLAIHSRGDAEPDSVLAEALDRTGVDHAIFHVDLGLPEEVAPLIDQVIAKFGCTPVLLVNNASLFELGGWKEADPVALARNMQVNCLAPITLARDIVTRCEGGARPAIVNILDQRVAQPVPDQFAYTVSKQALWQATRTMAVAFAPGARVNAVAPGPTLPTQDYSEAQWGRVGAMLPLQDRPTPAAVADAVLYLAGADHVTGQTIYVDGGAGLKGWDRDFMYL